MGLFRRKNDDLHKQLLKEAAQERQVHEAQRASGQERDWHAQVESLIAAGQTIAAIKVYRENTGLGLAEAKFAVDEMRDAMARGESVGASQPAPPDPNTPAWHHEVQALVQHGNVIAAIKVYRENTGLGLAEAKAAVDAIRDDMRRRGVIR